MPPEAVLGGGVAAGVLLCLLLYLAGAVPSLSDNPGQQQGGQQQEEQQQEQKQAETQTAADNSGDNSGNDSKNTDAVTANNASKDEDKPAEIELEFYTALEDYEVAVDAVPMEDGDVPPAGGYLIQSGAFVQLQLAQAEQRRQQGLGLQVRLQELQVQGRPLYRLQSGPYTSRDSLLAAEDILQRNHIASRRLIPQTP